MEFYIRDFHAEKTKHIKRFKKKKTYLFNKRNFIISTLRTRRKFKGKLKTAKNHVKKEESLGNTSELCSHHVHFYILQPK